ESRHIEDLRAHYATWRRSGDETIDRARLTDVTREPGFLSLMWDRKSRMDAMREIVRWIVDEEDRLLVGRQRRADQTARRILLGGFLFALLLGTISAVALRRLLGSVEAAYSAASRAEAASAQTAAEGAPT